jgi:hypothetical protein
VSSDRFRHSGAKLKQVLHHHHFIPCSVSPLILGLLLFALPLSFNQYKSNLLSLPACRIAPLLRNGSAWVLFCFYRAHHTASIARIASSDPLADIDLNLNLDFDRPFGTLPPVSTCE